MMLSFGSTRTVKLRLPALLLLVFLLWNPAWGDELTVVSWGGLHGAGFEQSYLVPFRESSGVSTRLQHYSGDLAQLREQVNSESVIWDVIDLNKSTAQRACDEGLLEVLPVEQLQPVSDDVSVRDDFLPGTLLPCAVGYAAWSVVFVFRDDQGDQSTPSSLADLFDLESFPGKRGLCRSPQGLLEWALIADGVTNDQVYKELSTATGLQRALDKLRTIRNHVVWWREPGDMQSLLQNGTVSMGSAYSSSVFDAVARDRQKLSIVWDSHRVNTHYLGVTRGSFRFSSAWEFVRFVSRSDRMPMISNHLGYAPLRLSAQQRIRPEYHHLLPTVAENYRHAFQVDKEWWDDNRSRVNQRFAAWWWVAWVTNQHSLQEDIEKRGKR